MTYHKEEISNFTGAKMREIAPFYILPKYKIASSPSYQAYHFMAKNEESSSADVNSIIQSKEILKKDRIDLILNSIKMVTEIKDQNLTSLYDDLLTIGSKYLEWGVYRDTTKGKPLDFLKEKLRIYDRIRQEKTNFAKSLSFISKELRDGLIDFKKQGQKTKVLNSLKDTLDDILDIGAGNYYEGNSYHPDLYRREGYY